MQTVQLQLGVAQAKLDFVNNRMFIGRDEKSCGLATGDVSLSRRHAEVFLDGDSAFIRDLGSSNGTWVDGQLVGAQPVALRAGQTVYLGTVPLVAQFAGGGPGGGSTVAVTMPAELRALVEQRKKMMAQMAQPRPQVAVAMPSFPMATPAPGFATPAPAGLGIGGRVAPLPAEFAYRRQGSNDNGALLIALRGDTFANNTMLDGFIEFTALDNETVASITVELVEFHKKGSSDGHVWDRMLVRQGPWRTEKGDVLPLPFQLRVPPGTSISGREVHWEVRAYVDINWASDISATSPIHMRNSDIERVRDALGALDFRIGDLESQPLGQRFEGTFFPPAQFASKMGINQLELAVEYLGANLKVLFAVDKKGFFKKDRENATVFELARFRTAPLAEVSGNFRQQLDLMMSMR